MKDFRNRVLDQVQLKSALNPFPDGRQAGKWQRSTSFPAYLLIITR